MSKKKEVPKEAFPLKIEKETLEAVRRKATEENRSTNNFIETLLKETVGGGKCQQKE